MTPAHGTAETASSAPHRRGVLLVDDHDLLRLGLKALLQSGAAEAAAQVTVFEARTLQAAMEAYRDHAAAIGVVLLDLELPDARGLAGLQAFLTTFPEARVVVLSGSTDPLVMRKTLAAGAVRFLAKSADLREVMTYLTQESLLHGDAPPAAEGGTAGAATPDSDSPPTMTVWTAGGITVELTQRQVEVLEGVLAGHSNRQIADVTHLTEGTIKNYVSSLLLLFGVRSRAELISQLR